MPAYPASPQDLADLFDTAIQLEGAERDAYLTRVIQKRPVLGRELSELVASHAQGSSLLDAPLAVALDGDLEGELSDELAAPLRHDDLVGSLVGEFAVVRHIGAGAMGDVYEALQERPRRRVALKVLADERRAGERFRIESEALARLDHPHIARVYGAGTTERSGAQRNLSWMAFEHIPDARTITEFAQDAELTLTERLRLFLPVARAIQHAHQKGVLHRDLKPANLLVGASEDASGDSRGHGIAKVIDFGLARIHDGLDESEQGRTRQGELLGTLRYMSPEQCSGDPALVDARSDIYGLGVVLYELLTGCLPYDLEGASILQIMDRIRSVAPADPRQATRSGGGRSGTQESPMDGDLSAVLMQALEKDPEARYGSAGELADDLQRWLNREPILARRASILHRARLFSRRRRPLFLGLCAGGAATIVALGVITALFFDNRAKLREITAKEALVQERAAEVQAARFQVAGLQGQLDRLDPEAMITSSIVDAARTATAATDSLEEQRAAIEGALVKLEGLMPLLADDAQGAQELANAFLSVGRLLGQDWGASADESSAALAAYHPAVKLGRGVRAAHPGNVEVERWLSGILMEQAGLCRRVGRIEEGRACADEAVALARRGASPDASWTEIKALLDALHARGDLHIDEPPFQRGLADAQEALSLVERLEKLEVPKAFVLDQRRWALLRLGHWTKRVAEDARLGALQHREACRISIELLEDAFAEEGGASAAYEAGMLFGVFGWNEVGAYARLKDDVELDRTLQRICGVAVELIDGALSRKVLIPATVLCAFQASRAGEDVALSLGDPFVNAWGRLASEDRIKTLEEAKDQALWLGSNDVAVGGVLDYLEALSVK